MPDAKAVTLLLGSLRSHDIPVDERDIQKALNSEDELAIEAWIAEHLSPETLLTKEELLQYSALQESGESEVFASSENLSLTRGIWDGDIEIAIKQLQKSTISIERQTEILRLKHEAVATLVKDTTQSWAARGTVESTYIRAWTTENNHVGATVDELLGSLKYQVVELMSLCKSTDMDLRKTASEILRVDDKILLGLQKLAKCLNPRFVGEDHTADRVRELCARLIKYTVEGVRTHLDTVYLHALKCFEDSSEGVTTPQIVEIDDLIDELDSLYTEILPVAQMTAEQQYLEPALRLIASHAAQDGDKSSKVVQHISTCLSEITHQLRDFTIDTEEYQRYRAAILTMTNTVKSELDEDRSPTRKTKQPGSPTRLRRHNKTISPILPRNTKRRSSATSFDDEANPELQILRNLGISVPIDLSNECNIAATLGETLEDRQAKFQSHSKNTQEVLEASIGSHLHDVKVTLQLLMKSLLSETEYKTVCLLDTEVQEAISLLENGVEELKGGIGTVDLDPLGGKNARRDNVVERWAT